MEIALPHSYFRIAVRPIDRKASIKESFTMVVLYTGLADEILEVIFGFVGPHQYRYVAGINRRSQRVYTELQKKHEARHSVTVTSGKSIVESLS